MAKEQNSHTNSIILRMYERIRKARSSFIRGMNEYDGEHQAMDARELHRYGWTDEDIRDALEELDP